MPVVVTLPLGEAAFEALKVTIVEAKRDDPLAPVTIVVPSNYAGLSLRRMLGVAGGVVNVRFLVMARLAELLGAPGLAGGRRPLTAWWRAEAVRSALVGHPGLFKDLARHEATEAALASTFRDLRLGFEGSLDQLAAASRRGADVVALYRRYRALTSGAYDLEDLASAAADAVRDGSQALQDVGRVVLYLPRALSPGERELVRELMSRDLADVILGLTGDATVDQVVSDLGLSLGAPLRSAAPGDVPPVATRILRAVDAEEEVRNVIRMIVDDLSRGVPLYRIGVLFASADSYAALVQEQFRAAGIPLNGPPVRPLASSMAGRVLFGMLRLPASGFRREPVMEWLSTGPVIETHEGESAGCWAPAHRWDELSRDAGVVKGMAQWRTRITAWSAARAAKDRPDDAQSGERLLAFVQELEQRLSPPRSATMAELGRWALGLLDRYLGSEVSSAAWGHEWDADAYAELRKALQDIANAEPLRDPASGLPLSTLEALRPDEVRAYFSRVLEAAFEQPTGRLGRFGDGVFAGPLKTAMGMAFDRVFVLGMVEGSIPAPAREDPLLPDDERLAVNLPDRAMRRVEARADYLAALASAPDRTLCFPQSSLRAQAKLLPSRWLLESATALAGEEITSERFERESSAPWLTAVASFEQALTTATISLVSSQEWELRSIARTGDPRRHFLADDPSFAASVEAATVRATPWARRYPLDASRLSPWAGGVGPGITLDTLRSYSPTAFESLATCAYSYFLKHVVHVKETVRPEQIVRISGADRGTIMHDALEQFLTEVRDAGCMPGPGEAWTERDRARLLEIGQVECDRAYTRGITGSELLWVVDRARIRRDLTLFLDDDTRRRAASGATFIGAEHSFGAMGVDGEPDASAWPAVTLARADGRSVGFRGRIDRVDRADDGTLIVYDYKSGDMRKYKVISTGDDRLVAGTRLQLPIYALAARQALGSPETPVEAHYWFISEREQFESIGYRVTPGDEAALAQAVDVLATVVEEGLFPPVPGKRDTFPNRRTSFDNCRYCGFDQVCAGGDRARAWTERKDAPALASYVALSERVTGEDDESASDD